MATKLYVNGVEVATGRSIAVAASTRIVIESASAAEIRIRTDVNRDTRPLWYEVKLAEAGKKIAAIKAYRERTGAGLRESKEAIEAAMAPVQETPRW